MAWVIEQLIRNATLGLVAVAALAFAAGLVAMWRARSRNKRQESWFHGLSPMQKAAAALVVVLFTLWGGAKPDGGDRGNDDVPSYAPEQGEVPRSGNTNGAEVASLCFTSISVVSNDHVCLSVVWPTNLFDEVHILDLFAKTNLLEGEWRWIGNVELLPGETNREISVALAALADGTNAPACAFFTVSDRESCNQTMADRDGDGIPDVYEIRNGTNPYVPDAALAPRLTVGTSGSYASITEALAASTNYSIISLAPETFIEASPIFMPTHPVMLICEDGYAVIRSSATIGAFIFDNGQNTRTLLRGLYVVLEARSSYQAAFWCGGSLPWSGVSATPSFEDIRIRAPYPEPLYYGWHFYRYTSGAASIHRCTINAAGATSMTGIYSYDGPPLDIRCCTAVNFPHDAALYLRSSADNFGGMTAEAEVSVESLALDQSFTNAYMLARFESGTNFVVSLNRAIIPELPEAPHVPDFMENVCVTNAGLSWNGLALPGSAAREFGIGDVRDIDFSTTADFDGDGISDYDEVFVYDTDPWLADSDVDGVNDWDELLRCTNPRDYGDFINIATVIVTNSAEVAGNLVFSLYGGTAPYTNAPMLAASFQTGPTNSGFVVSGLVVSNTSSLASVAFNDLNGNGHCDIFERCITNFFSLSSENDIIRVSLVKSLFDNDDDDMPDVWEYSHGFSHTNRTDATADLDGDGLINLHECWANCCPTNYDGQNTLLAALSRSVDDRINGCAPHNTLNLYNGYPSCGTNLVSNMNCWAGGIDFSCASPWNSYNYHRMYAATAISSRHVVLAKHHTPSSLPQKYFFVGTNGIVYGRSIVATKNVGLDITVALLDSDLPAAVRPAKVLPPNYKEYIGSGKCLPMVLLDQYEKAYVFEVSNLYDSCTVNHVERYGVVYQNSSNATRAAFTKALLIDGDSGNPHFFIVENELVLTGLTWANNGFGENFAKLVPQLQAAMDYLATGYSLQLFDFSSFQKL